MAERTDNLILEHMKAIRAILTRVEEDIRDIKLRLASLEQGQADGYNTHARQQMAIDKLGERLARVEKRLELTD